MIEIEWILGLGPLLALSGVMAWAFSRKTGLLAAEILAVSAPLLTAVVALLISGNDWSPRDAKVPCVVILMAYALAAAGGSRVVYQRLGQIDSSQQRGASRAVRFRLRTVFVLTTIACLVAAIVGRLVWRGEMVMFAAYGTIVLTLCLLTIAARWVSINSSTKKEPGEASPGS